MCFCVCALFLLQLTVDSDRHMERDVGEGRNMSQLNTTCPFSFHLES